MRILRHEDQNVAGPSSRPYVYQSIPVPTASLRSSVQCSTSCPFLDTFSADATDAQKPQVTQAAMRRLDGSKLKKWEVTRRQENEGDLHGSSSSSYNEGVASIFTSDYSTATTASITNSSYSYSPSSTYTYFAYNTSVPYPSNSSYNASEPYYTSNLTSTSISSSKTSSTHSSSPKQAYTTSFTSLWSYSASKKTATAAASKSTSSSYVPGVVLNMTMAGTSDTQAVYSVEMAFGHDDDNSRRKRAFRKGALYGQDGTTQYVNLQVDLGSSDMWVATTDCSSSDCQNSPYLFDSSLSLDSGVDANLTYQSGSVDGTILWEEVKLGGFGIGFQAFVGATDVENEDLEGGKFSGVLGLALPASSTILDEIGGTTGSNPDGATFLDNLFGAGSSAPSKRLFALSLERRQDVRTSSTFGIGAIDPTYCPSPCNLTYAPIIAQPSLGSTGYLHWRLEMQALTVTTFSDEQNGEGATTKRIALGASKVYPSKNFPLAVLDSGGVQILVSSRSYADSIYSAFGITASSDGLYRMRCTQQLALTFMIAGQQIPVHPLDMSYEDPSDVSQKTCIGMIQYSDNLGDSGDFILGSSFLKNVYSVYRYPDTDKHKTWQPTVGLVPLTNASVASQDFYSVRVLHESLGTVSSDQSQSSGGSSSTNSGGSNASEGDTSRRAVSSAVIAVISVIGFFVLAAAAFCAWWFWLRRKFGASGVVEYKTAGRRRRPSPQGQTSDRSTSTLRSRKHVDILRQKSMIEGYDIYNDQESWVSGTEGADSIRLGYIPEALEEEEEGGGMAGTGGRSVDRSSQGSSIARSLASKSLHGEDEGVGVALMDNVDPLSPGLESTTSGSRGRSPGRTSAGAGASTSYSPFIDPPTSIASDPFPTTGPATTGPYPSPLPPSHSKSPSHSHNRSPSMGMSGPFPSPSGSRFSTMNLDSSPMYDIRTSDYFSVPGAQRGKDGKRSSSSTTGRENGHRKASPSKASGRRSMGNTLVEESGDEEGNQKESK
ncbi:endopeptidase [Cryptococcus neoformans Ze90-1]|nr:endopeptidase [Cryptococcus neoformans var. grubii Ze90-1]